VDQKKLDEAAALLVQIIRAQTATAELRANSMLLSGKIQEQKGNLESAVDQFIKISVYYEGVPAAASEGLWRGGQLHETLADRAPDQQKKTLQRNRAIQAYRDLTTKYPASPFAEQAAARLAQLAPGK
jgi:outer membrane protein assembly factor BamD (BamD/ComL family)